MRRLSPERWAIVAVALAACGKTSSGADLNPTHSTAMGAGGTSSSSSSVSSASTGFTSTAVGGSGGSTTNTGAGGMGATDVAGAGGESGAAGAGNAPATCLGLDAYSLDNESGPDYALYFLETDAGCHAVLAPQGSEPEVYDVSFVDGAVELNPRSYSAYFEEPEPTGRFSVIVTHVNVRIDGAGLPTQATLSNTSFWYNWDFDVHSEAEEIFLVKPLSLEPVLRVPTVALSRSARPFLPWESVSLLVSPPLVNFDALSTPDNYGAWQPQDLGSPQIGSEDYVYPGAVRNPNVLNHSGVSAASLAWTHGVRQVSIELGPTKDIGGRLLQGATTRVPFVNLPTPRVVHEFDGDDSFLVYNNELTTAPAECGASGCLGLLSPEGEQSEAAGTLDTSGADTVRVQAYGSGLVRILRPSGEVLYSASLDGGPMPLIIPTEDPYVGVYFAARPELFVDRVWAE